MNIHILYRLRHLVCLSFYLLTTTEGVGETNEMALVLSASQLRLPTPPESAFEKLSLSFRERSEYVVTNRLHALWTLEYLFEEEELRLRGINGLDHVNRTGERIFSRSATLALRKFAIEDTLAEPMAKELLESARRFVRSSFGGQEERGQLQSLHNPEEGLFITDRFRAPTGVRFFFRPLRTDNPYTGVSYGRKGNDGNNLYTLNLRYYYREWEHHTGELIGEVPLLHEWFLFGSVRARAKEFLRDDGDERNDEDILLGAVGVRGQLKGAHLYLSADLYPHARVLATVSIPLGGPKRRHADGY